jgi:hypothetical protein
MQPDGLHDLLTYRSNRAHGCHRLLKDHRDLVSSNASHLSPAVVETHKIDHLRIKMLLVIVHRTMIKDLSFHNPAWRGDDPHDRLSSDRLAATTLTDYAKCLPLMDSQVDSIYCPNNTLNQVKLRFQIADLKKQRILIHCREAPLCDVGISSIAQAIA